MKAVDPVAVRDVLLLSLAAGSADAVGFIGLGHVFTSNMTGNVVLLGIAVGQGHLNDAVRSIFVLGVFVFGVALSVRLGRHVRDSDWPRLVQRLLNPQKLLLLLFAIGWMIPREHLGSVSFGLLAALAMAMGLQSVALSRLGAPGVGTTAITGTITALVTGLVVRVDDPVHGSSVQRLAFQASVLALYFLGAAADGLLLMKCPWFAGVLPFLAAACVWHKVPLEKA